MIQTFLETLTQELHLPFPKERGSGDCSFILNSSITVKLKDLGPGIGMQGKLTEVPPNRKEELFMHLMQANLLGQGTGVCRIGMMGDEKTLTLLMGLPYEVDYQRFKQALEDFVNHLMFWRNEINRFVHEKRYY